MQFFVLLQKELLEVTRDFKLVWIPLVYVLFGISEPVSMYYMPEIIGKFGGLPEGTVIPTPNYDGAEVIAATVSQYQFMGMLLFVFAFSGIIAKERENGKAALLYVRPISFVNYYMSKWATVMLLLVGSTFLGLIVSWFYTGILFDYVAINDFMLFFVQYKVWLILVTTTIVTMSSLFRTTIAALSSFAIVVFVPMIISLIGVNWTIHPWKVSTYAVASMSADLKNVDVISSNVISLLLTVVLIVLGIYGAKRNTSKIKI